ncbi:hypothetical protein BDW62DRAFT_123069 [Aspergillus aurantiobrunneus]
MAFPQTTTTAITTTITTTMTLTLPKATATTIQTALQAYNTRLAELICLEEAHSPIETGNAQIIIKNLSMRAEVFNKCAELESLGLSMNKLAEFNNVVVRQLESGDKSSKSIAGDFVTNQEETEGVRRWKRANGVPLGPWDLGVDAEKCVDVLMTGGSCRDWRVWEVVGKCMLWGIGLARVSSWFAFK